MGREFTYILNSLIKWGVFLGILYLIFTNFGTFLIILFIIICISYYIIYKFKKKIKEATGSSGSFEFRFNAQDFSNMGNNRTNFNFRDFEEQFRRNSFQNGTSSISEITKAKKFFNFTTDPTKEEIKKRYKELAKKYHPDINDHGDELMQQLNHYKDILLQAFE